MTQIRRTSRLSIRKTHPDLRQGRVLEGNGYIPQKRKCVNAEREWGPRYRASEDGQEPGLFHRSWCGGSDKALYPAKRQPEDLGFEEERAFHRSLFGSSAMYGQYLLPAGPGIEASRSGQFVQARQQAIPKQVSSSTRPVTEETLPMFSPKLGAAVQLPGWHVKDPKSSVNRHPRRSVYEIYFGDDFGPDFEAAQVATRASADVLSK